MRFTIKKFLSDSPSESGNIVITCETPLMKDIGRYQAENPSVDCQVAIADCSKTIYLDFNMYKESDVRKRQEKLDVLIDSLIELKNRLPEFWEDAKVNSSNWVVANPTDTTDENN